MRNWMRVTLRNLGLQAALIGGIAGAWAGLASVAALHLGEDTGFQFLRIYLPVWVLGAVFGLLLAPASELLHRYPQRSLWAALAGGLLGGGGAILAFGGLLALSRLHFTSAPIGGDIIIPFWLRWIWFSGIMALVSAGTGLGAGVGIGNLTRGFRRMLRGGIAGALGGLPLAILLHTVDGAYWAIVVGIALWGTWIALVLFWLEHRSARHWLRQITGSDNDPFFPLDQKQITLGKTESNDIPLIKGEEIYPQHCKINWVGNHYEIIDNEQDGIVLVNYRQVQEHPLKSGDLIKIGSVLLQYGEVST